MKRFLFTGLLMIFSVPAIAQWEDMTDSFTEDLSRKISGMSVGKGPTTIDSSCRTRVLGRCVLEETIRAQGSVSIGSRLHTSGVIKRFELYDPVHEEWGYNYASSLYMEFRYNAQVSAKKYVGGNEVDTVWGSLHPEGIVKIWFIARRTTGYDVKFRFEAAPGHNDAPNRFVMNHMTSKFRYMIRDRAKAILGLDYMEIIH